MYKTMGPQCIIIALTFWILYFSPRFSFFLILKNRGENHVPLYQSGLLIKPASQERNEQPEDMTLLCTM